MEMALPDPITSGHSIQDLPYDDFSAVCLPVPILFLYLHLFGQILPSSSGVEGFIRIQSMGASFSDVLHEVRILWILTIVYGGFAAVGIHLRLKQAAGK